MTSFSELRAIAMSMPEVVEGPPVPAARRIASFKVGGKSFIGVEKGCATVTIALPEKAAKALVAEHPGAYAEIWRDGKIFMGLRVHLSVVSAHGVHELVEISWRHKAPKNMVAAFDKRIS